MHNSVLAFGDYIVTSYWDLIHGAEILEVGSQNVNGSLRELFENGNPKSYLGVDMQPGPGVDKVMNAENLTSELEQQFDWVICTEVLEHCEHWQEVINEMKYVVKPGGYIVITTRSKGFPYHEYPGDYWRYSVFNMAHIFRDFDTIEIMYDPDINSPGVFYHGQKLLEWKEPCSLDSIVLDTP